MLNSEIKRKIDNARDILVWKIPVPSQQIEQITVGLIYKFMSDIDLQDKELGWEGFFQWEFEKYSWNNIMDRKIWGQERLNLYSEWLDKMGTNPHLPQMFRDIFRNAYLPFKDPSTLDMFLKQIDEFSYDHSEDLGDAFEYLLSTAWSQWDAGQFRTPRHIIDFIVSIVQPQLTDTVLDPACGTAWFLISAYKYIMNQNKDKVAWDKLSLTQKKELTQHFVWYDISYEMVRLSLVNMYLHNFWDPKIFEYDTLSNDDRWDDRFDCILANPPFMTPKGWIQPHNRFSIKASKSEVLFVDYMIEHLNPHGKAWIVVPEGIIFQWANAYKDLRKKMIKENFLWAVVSLPAWVFQPYAWVKTSILLFDQELAKKTDKILFVKVQNDGFDLWAQRRPINKNDIPKATEILLQYKKDLLAWNEINLSDSEMTLLVSKEKIEENSEFNLSMDRYREKEIFYSSFPNKRIWELCRLQSGFAFDSKKFNDIKWTPIIRIRDIKPNKTWTFYDWDYNEEFIVKNWDLLIWMDWEFNNTLRKWWDALLNQRVCKLYGFDWVLKEYVNYMISLKLKEIEKDTFAVTVKHISWKQILDIKIPLPPLEVQEKIVAELDGYQKVIDWAKMIVDNYKPTIKINPDWENIELGKICTMTQWIQIPLSDTITDFEPWYKRYIYISDLIDDNHIKYVRDIYPEKEVSEKDLIMVNTWNTSWRIYWWKKWILSNNVFKIVGNDDIVTQKYLYYYLKWDYFQNSLQWQLKHWAQPHLWHKIMSEQIIPLPPLEEQNQIVAEIEKEEAMVESAKQLIEVFEKKIKERIDEIWGR